MTNTIQANFPHAGRRVPGGRHHAWLAEARELLRLAVPLALTQLAQMVILATDSIMLGHLSKDALAAAALGNAMFFFTFLLGCGPTSAVSPMIAHILGGNAHNRAGVRAVVRMGLWSVALVSVPLVAVMGFTGPILLFLGQDPKLAADAARFVSTLCFSLPFALGFQVLRNFSTALSRPLAPLIVMALSILFNAAGDYALIFGHFGAPAWGLAGAGLSSTLSNIFGVVTLAAIILWAPGLRDYRILKRWTRPDWAKLKEIFWLGVPIGLTMIFEIGLFNGATLCMGLFGTVTLAAHQIAIMIPSVTFMVPLGIGMAGAVRVGLAAGAGDAVAARRAGFTTMGMGGLFMAAMSLVLLAFPETVAHIFLSDDPVNRPVIALAVVFLHVAALFQIADGLQVTASMALRGLKDARMPMWLAGGAYWLAGAPLCVVLGFGTSLKGLGVWLGLAFGLFVAATALVARFNLLSGARNKSAA